MFYASSMCVGNSCDHECGHEDGRAMGGMDGQSMVRSSRGRPSLCFVDYYLFEFLMLEDIYLGIFVFRILIYVNENGNQRGADFLCSLSC